MALERAIARLSQHKELADHLVFKGGFVLLKNYESLRFTRDADALAVAISKERLMDHAVAALAFDLDDGIWFGDVQVQELTDQGEYGSYRFDCAFQIGTPDLKKLHKLSRIHIDIGFSDVLPSKPGKQLMRSVLDHESPVTWRFYPIEFILAEKLQTLFDRGSANSRAKDIYDLNYLFPRCEDKNALAAAIQMTFKNRETRIPTSLVTEANQFDKTILSLAWPGVRIFQNKPSFSDAWAELLHHLTMMDLLI